MKKIALSLIIFLLIPMVISAEINVSVTDSVNNKLCISGDAQALLNQWYMQGPPVPAKMDTTLILH